LWLANCYFAHDSLGFPVLLPFFDGQSGRFFLIHLIATMAQLLGPGGVRSIVAESLLLKHQLLIVNRSRHRSPNLRAFDRVRRRRFTHVAQVQENAQLHRSTIELFHGVL
jgi:hypothetical protein